MDECAKEVIIMETEEVFPSIQSCANWLKVARSTVSDHLIGGSNSCHGYHICYKEKYNKDDNPWKGKAPVTNTQGYSKRVMCIDTGEVFNSTGEAGKIMGLLSTSIALVASGKRKSTGGHKFKYVE